jgi:DNA-directed RNA polymerase subunit alpha
MDYKIMMPSRPKIVSEEGNKGVYEIEGCYAGYGYTLGNSLRRIILSSIPGAAITSIKVDGVAHEFSKIDGVKEDVITIILNLKKLRFKVHSDEPQNIKLSVHGIKDVFAKDIEFPSQVEILNKNEHVATLTAKDAKLNIEMVVERGLGYVSKENINKEKVEIGTIVMDAVFTPIRRVNYEVENMRVGDKIDYNRLRFFIETDGSISPREALENSIETMINHLKAIVGFQEKELSVEETENGEEKLKEIKDEFEDTEIMKMRIEDLQFSSRTFNALSEGGIRTLGGLARKKEGDLREIKGVGEKAIQEIRRALGNYGLTLK